VWYSAADILVYSRLLVTTTVVGAPRDFLKFSKNEQTVNPIHLRGRRKMWELQKQFSIFWKHHARDAALRAGPHATANINYPVQHFPLQHFQRLRCHPQSHWRPMLQPTAFSIRAVLVTELRSVGCFCTAQNIGDRLHNTLEYYITVVTC